MQSNRMWWDKAVCGLAHHPVSSIRDKGNRTQSFAALRRGKKKYTTQQQQNPKASSAPTSLGVANLGIDTEPQATRDDAPATGCIRMATPCDAPTYGMHHKATSLGLTKWLLCDLHLSWERKMSQQGQQRLTLPGCPGIEPHTGLAPALKGTVQFLGSHRYLPCGNCSQSSHSPWLSKTCGMCFTASQTDEGCGRVKMVSQPRASSSGHQESFSRQARSWLESNKPGGSQIIMSLFYCSITSSVS